MRPQRKQRLMTFLENYFSSNREAPTIKEIKEYFGWTSNATVHDQLVELEGMGLIKRTPNISRGIEIVK